MLNRAIIGAALIAVTLPLSACQTTADGRTTVSKTGAGAVAGGLLGGLLCTAVGGNAAQCIAAAGAGALAGGSIGARMDARDRVRHEYAMRAVLNDNARWADPASARPEMWSNPETGNNGTIRPIRSFVQQNRTCKVVEVRYVRKGEPVVTQEQTCT